MRINMNYTNKFQCKGFSLVEVLVTASVLIVVGIVISVALTRTFKGNTKTELISTIKQNGQLALSEIEKEIRNAESVICPISGSSVVMTLRTKTTGKYVRFIMVPEAGQVNGNITRDFPSYPPSTGVPSDMCNLAVVPITPATTLTDNSSQSGISLKNIPSSPPAFIIARNPGYREVVTVQFELGPGVSSGSNYEGNLGSASNTFGFKTSVQLR
jgi:type II secretory pathway pseudopilin PulG